MDISKNFTDSLRLLQNNLVVPLVVFLANLVFIGIIFLAVFALTGYFVFNPENIHFSINLLVNVIVGIIVLSALGAYAGCTYWAMVALAVKGKKLDFSSVLNLSNHLFFRFIYLNFLIGIVILSPVLLAIILVVCVFLVSKILGILLAIFGIFASLAYIIYMAVRTIFAIPMSFLDGIKARDSILKSFSMTKGRFKDTGFVFLIIIAVSLIMGFSGGFSQGHSGIFSLLFIGLSTLIFQMISAIVTTFIYAFLFYSYLDFKKDGRPKAGRLSKKRV